MYIEAQLEASIMQCTGHRSVTGAKYAKISPHKNFALYGIT